MTQNQIPVMSYIKEAVAKFYNPETIIGNIRIEHSRHQEITKLLQSLGGYVCMPESTGCEHFHFAIHSPKVNRDTIAKKIRTAFPELKKQSIGGAKQYHVALMKQDFQLLYIFKEWHKDTNPFTMTNLSLLNNQPQYDNPHTTCYYHSSLLKDTFAAHCSGEYSDQKESFKKHTPGQFLEYLTKETSVIKQHNHGIDYEDMDVTGPEAGIPYTTNIKEDSHAFRKTLAHHAIDYLKKIDIATCGPNKIWDLVNYAHLHCDQEQYTEHILENSFSR